MPFLRQGRTRDTRLLAVPLVLSLANCGTELDVWNGAHITYKNSTSLTTCRGTHTYVDTFIPFVVKELGLGAPPHVEYQWLDTADFDAAPCRGVTSGCAGDRTAYSPTPALLHELVHTVTWTNGMNNHLFFTEGIAVAYDPWNGNNQGPRYLFGPDPDAPLPDPRLALGANKDELNYPLAGSFVTFLLTRHGPAKFVALTRGLDAGSDLPAIRSSFQEIYDLDFDVEAELFISGKAPCTNTPFSVRVYDCAMPEVAWGDDGWSFTAGMDCEKDPVVGGLDAGAATPSIRSVTLQVPAAGQYTLSIDGEEGVLVQAGPCFGCPWIPGEVGAPAGEEITVELAAGIHYVRIRGQADQAADVHVEIRPGIAP